MNKKNQLKDWVTPSFVARRFCLSPSTIRKHIDAGNIEAFPSRVNRKGKPSGYRIKRTEVMRLDRCGIRPRIHNFNNGLSAA
ncbi:hypothetical protein [Cerasicoccus frondis]|uniref:hypothetical protein n=1 Tax=Cerasicoccus frondis TaxID=490090 RepID=UPI002852CDC0|nr:hypothetical protein [Cerasicoccus frondis]